MVEATRIASLDDTAAQTRDFLLEVYVYIFVLCLLYIYIYIYTHTHDLFEAIHLSFDAFDRAFYVAGLYRLSNKLSAVCVVICAEISAHRFVMFQ